MKLEHIVIAGAPRSGTTSLFKYLADHPDICGSDLKQTLFFLDLDYKDIPSTPLFHYSNGIKTYDNFFKNHKEGQIKLEATPDYLYSNNTATVIYNCLEKVHLIFILRNPIARLESLFFHGKSTGYINKELSLDDFIVQCLSNNDSYGAKMLRTGNYFQFLQQFISRFNREQISILFLEEMQKTPRLILSDLCSKFGIDDAVYDDFQFVQHNQKQEVKNESIFQVYKKLRLFFLNLTMKSPIIKTILEIPKKIVSRSYQKLNTTEIKTETTTININQKHREQIQQFYADDVRQLEGFLGRKTPWNIKNSSNVR